MIVSAELIDRLIASEAIYTAIRAQVIGRWPDNRFGVALRQIGGAHGVQVKGVPSPWLNRVLGLDDADTVPAWRDWFTSAGIAGRFEMLPHRFTPALGRALLVAGLAPAGGDALVCGRPAPAGSLEAIEHAETADTIEVFLDTHLDGLEIPLALRDGVVPATLNLDAVVSHRAAFSALRAQAAAAQPRLAFLPVPGFRLCSGASGRTSKDPTKRSVIH